MPRNEANMERRKAVLGYMADTQNGGTDHPFRHHDTSAGERVVSTTVAEGYNGFHACFSKFTGEIFDSDFNVQLSTAIQLFNSDSLFQLPQPSRYFQCSTVIETFNRDSDFQCSTVIPTFNRDSVFQRPTAIALSTVI